MGALLENECAQCGQTFLAYRYEIEVRGRRFCSAECAQAPRRIERPSKDELLAAYQAGKSTNDLANDFGVSKGTIYNWFRHYEIGARSIGASVSIALKGKPASEHRKQAIAKAQLANHAHKDRTRLCEYCKSEFELDRPSSPKRFCSRHCAAMKQVSGRPRGRRGAKSGRRETLGGLFVRSSWEHNVALWLNWRIGEGEIESWDYEPECFEFPVKRGNRTYTPDFRVNHFDGTHEWLEVKGWLDQDSKVKLKRFAQYYPHEHLTLIDRAAYTAIKKEFAEQLEGWE